VATGSRSLAREWIFNVQISPHFPCPFYPKWKMRKDWKISLGILGDAGALSNAFMNLFVNAVDAMPKDGNP